MSEHPKRDTDPTFSLPDEVVDRFFDSQRPPAPDVCITDVEIPKDARTVCPLCASCPLCGGCGSVTALVAAEYIRCTDIDLTKDPEDDHG